MKRMPTPCGGWPSCAPDKNLVIGPVGEKNYKQIGAGAIAYKHTLAASSPIDVNLAKQLNVLLGNLGVPDGQILVDPTTGGLGYGIEYTYSVMERDRMAALTQQDERLQFPIICNLAKEVWKTKEAKLPEAEEPRPGRPEETGDPDGSGHGHDAAHGRGQYSGHAPPRSHSAGEGDDRRSMKS